MVNTSTRSSTSKVAASSACTSASLLPEHQRYFRERAVDPPFAETSGARSITAEEAEQYLGYRLRTPQAGIAFVYAKTSPPFVRIRLDDGSYLTPVGCEIPIFSTSGAECPNEPLIVTESPTKAMALALAGFAAVGLGGVNTCLTKSFDLNTSWHSVPLVGRVVIILFDNDMNKPQIARALAKLVIALQRAGAKVRYAVLPAASEKVGPDDFLAKHGAEALKAIIDDAVLADPIERVQPGVGKTAKVDSTATLTSLLDDTAFLISVLVGGDACIARCRSEFRKAKLTSDFARALKTAKEKLHEADASGETLDPSYEIKDGALHTPDGRRLTNFDARIVEQIAFHDGADIQTQFVLRTVLDDGTPLRDVTLQPCDFLNRNWATERLGAAARIMPGRNSLDETASGIQSLSKPKHTDIYGHTGFLYLDGVPIYLMPGNNIGHTARVELPSNLHYYGFVASRHDLAEAISVVFDLLRVGPERIVWPLFLGVLRAPLNSILRADFVEFLYGTTSSMKSTLAALIACFYGTFTYSSLPASFSDTAASLEFKANVIRDAPLVVDELVQRTNSLYDDAINKAIAFIRSAGNGAAKGRMKRDLSARAERPPNALIIATGESLPMVESILARTLAIQMQPGELDLEVLTRVQSQSDVLGEFTRAYIEWIRLRLGMIETWAKVRHTELRNSFQHQQQHLRSPSITAHLMLGAELFVMFCEHEGVLSLRECDAFLETAQEAVLEAAARQRAVIEQASPAKLFLNILGALLQTGRVLLGTGREDPSQPEFGNLVGWRIGNEIILLEEVAYGAVAKALRDRGEAMPVSADTLWRRLRDEGILIADKGRLDSKRTVSGNRRRAKVLRGDALDDVFKTVPTPGRPVAPH